MDVRPPPERGEALANEVLGLTASLRQKLQIGVLALEVPPDSPPPTRLPSPADGDLLLGLAARRIHAAVVVRDEDSAVVLRRNRGHELIAPNFVWQIGEDDRRRPCLA